MQHAPPVTCLQLIDGKVYEVSADVVVQNDEHIMTFEDVYGKCSDNTVLRKLNSITGEGRTAPTSAKG